MVADVTSACHRDILFRTSKSDKNSAPMFIKPPGTTDVTLKMFYNGAFVTLDENRCLQWMQQNAWRIVKAAATESDIDSVARRSGRIAGLKRVNYEVPLIKRQRKQR